MAGVSGDLVNTVALLGAAVVAVPLFKRLGLGSVLGYLVAGIVIGPSVAGLFGDPEAVLHVAELGVVMLLFVIGLEMNPSRLWALRRDIFGLGLVQVAGSGALMSGAAILVGVPPVIAVVAAMGFVLTSTATVLQLMNERGEANTPRGQRVVSILLLEDLAIVPLLAVVSLLAPAAADADAPSRLTAMAIAAACVIGLVAAGRWLLNPMFSLLAAARAREIMTAAALLVVLGAALLMQFGGLSMAMGAFLAGVLLSESNYRHELEADIEPFRGLLLGLFFLGVGMSIDLAVIASAWPVILGAALGFMAVKMVGIYVVARLFRASHPEALRRTLLMAQGGEFAFVLYAAAGGALILDAATLAVLNAAVILSMAATPLLVLLGDRLIADEAASMDGVDEADGLTGSVLVIGFGRFGQVASQCLLARGIDVSIIDDDPDMIRSAADFGFKIYYGDGTRPEVLRAAGAAGAAVVAVCVDRPEAATRIVELCRHEFPQARLHVRAYDRGHAISLIAAGVDHQMRETFESALAFGEATLAALVPADEAATIATEVRRRDLERLALQQVGGIRAGRDLMVKQGPVPTPLTPPRRPGRALSEETAAVAARAAAEEAGQPAS